MDETAVNTDKITEVQNLNFKKFNNYTPGSSESESQEIQDLNLQKFGKQTSRNSESELAEIQRPDTNYTNYNQTEKSDTDMCHTNLINQSPGSVGGWRKNRRGRYKLWINLQWKKSI